MKATLFTVILLVCTPILFAQTSVRVQPIKPTDKPPWEWTVEERHRHLLQWDLVQRQRAAVEDSELTNGRRMAPTRRGSENPELFFPSEIFDILVSTIFAPDPEAAEVWREIYAEKVSTYLGSPAEVWERLETAAVELIWIQAQTAEIAKQLETADESERKRIRQYDASVQARHCAATHEGLRNARTALGNEAFDRFLYEAAAPTMFISHIEGEQDSLEHRLWIEGGCK